MKALLKRRSRGRGVMPTALVGLTIVAMVGLVMTPAAAQQHHHRCTTRSFDSDHDHLPDCWEMRNGLRVGRHDQLTDADLDGLYAIQEYRIDVSTTGDRGIFFPYRANEWSTDGAKYSDGERDLDADGFDNVQEIVFRSDVLDAASVPVLPPSGCLTVPTTVRSDGSMDVTARLQAVIDTAPDGGCLDLAADARFRSNGTLTVFDRHDLTINGNGATIFSNVRGPVDTKGTPRSHRQQFVIAAGSNINVDSLVIKGPNPVARSSALYEFEAGLVVAGTDGAVLSNLTISHVYGDFIHFTEYDGDGGQGVPLPAQNILVTGGHFSTAGRQGLMFSEESNHITVENSTFDGMGHSGIDIELVTPEKNLSDVTIQDNTFSNFNLFWVSAKGKGTATGIHFLGNQLVGETMQVKIGPPDWAGTRDSDFSFVGNSSDTALQGNMALFLFDNTDNVTVEGNTQEFRLNKSSGIAVGVIDGCGYTVGGNTFANVQQELLFMTGLAC